MPKPNESAPKIAAFATSNPVFKPPSVCSFTFVLKLLCSKIFCVSNIPVSHGDPACLIDDNGLAPVPPSCPEIVIKSAFALTTPAATIPTPGSETNFTDT